MTYLVRFAASFIILLIYFVFSGGSVNDQLSAVARAELTAEIFFTFDGIDRDGVPNTVSGYEDHWRVEQHDCTFVHLLSEA